MARRYTRDNRGRFASVGATARGGRLKTASGERRATVTRQITAKSGKTISRPKGYTRPAPKDSPATKAPAGRKPKFEKVKHGPGRRVAYIGEGRRINISNTGKDFTATLVGKDGAPRMQRKGLRNITAAKAWGSNPNARGPRLMGGGLNTEASPSATWFRGSRRTGSTVGRPKGYKPQSAARLRAGLYLNRARSVNAKTASRPDIAEQHIPGRFRGQAGKRLDASIDRAVAQVKAAERARLMKPKEQVRAEAVARKAAKDAAAAAKPKRTRTPLSMRTSRAKRILKEREIKISGTYRQWENSRRTQERALAYYAQQGRRR